MATTAFTRSSLACVAVCMAFSASTVLAQPEGLPNEGGIYYRSGSNWDALQRTLFMPMMDGQVRDFFNVGHRGAIAELPGPQALVRSSSARPVFYVRGFSPANGLYLVRAKSQRDARDVHMRVDRDSLVSRFRNQDLNAFDIEPVAPDLVTLRPRANLARASM